MCAGLVLVLEGRALHELLEGLLVHNQVGGLDRLSNLLAVHDHFVLYLSLLRYRVHS